MTLDQAVTRSRNLVEAHLDDNLRAFATRLLLAGEDVDHIDALLEHFKAANEQAVEEHIARLRAELATEFGLR